MSESKKAYVRQMKHYLKTGDWIAQYMGAKENERTVWTCTAMAYNADGTPSVQLVFGILTFVKSGLKRWKMVQLP